MAKNEKWLLRDFDLHVSESMAGQLESRLICPVSQRLFRRSVHFGPAPHGKTGPFGSAGMELAEGITVENLSWNFLHAGGPEIALTAECFGGSLRSDLTFRTSGGTLDMAAWATNIPLDRLASLLGIPGEITGKLAEETHISGASGSSGRRRGIAAAHGGGLPLEQTRMGVIGGGRQPDPPDKLVVTDFDLHQGKQPEFQRGDFVG